MLKISQVRRALISVSDKLGIVEFASELSKRNFEIISTGGTANLLADAGLSAIKVSDYTCFPEILKGRVKTLHPKIHGGILGCRGEDDTIMSKYSIEFIDIVVVNLYPFAKTIANKDCLLDDAIENIDIGGPAMIRAAAKNYTNVAIVVYHTDYNNIIKEMDLNKNSLTQKTRFALAIKAFKYTAKYDNLISSYLFSKSYLHDQDHKVEDIFLPKKLEINFIKRQDLRYGENNHQQAAFYIEENSKQNLLDISNQVQGKLLSYNNILDVDTAINCINQFDEPACVIVKHGNPCGVSLCKNTLDAYIKAYNSDPVSAFGGVIALNRDLNSETARYIISHQFIEVIVIPSASDSVLNILHKKPNIRVLIVSDEYKQLKCIYKLDFKTVIGGLLVQEKDMSVIKLQQCHVVSQRKPTQQELDDAIFCWKITKFVKSNAIVYARKKTTIGIGAGQMSRIFSAKIAALKAADAGLVVEGAVMASDAFFPFRDSVDAAAALGITCIVQPGGSIRDNQVIDAANEHKISMIFTKMRHFRH
ncbi:bifunctional phosphoribosylaminoimidazolecarboxamide formyltransferase/IMP cyclohydrolase [Candidatus Ishikawella capsulata]|uniref:Bifunctional purine biosynthesis protein PurH n=1 Tax=Candidatus Ishikawaella capsulata Mpkobe TaxID=476281 RepID=C5WDG2_9ENTR|nr:bifunctional phosphoribosylaminoimidazolecarboxamide formyltransferase/IMP cyclohydrolase [Candidatus Ishikawaella capsulata]BAH83368.1 bifunctional phosphoribosylaminoimidazolecarboxamide formyltransferase/IMP cyclohydrolase [Candidatus Ishikawaella capsulata Mpkobe]